MTMMLKERTFKEARLRGKETRKNKHPRPVPRTANGAKCIRKFGGS